MMLIQPRARYVLTLLCLSLYSVRGMDKNPVDDPRLHGQDNIVVELQPCEGMQSNKEPSVSKVEKGTEQSHRIEQRLFKAEDRPDDIYDTEGGTTVAVAEIEAVSSNIAYKCVEFILSLSVFFGMMVLQSGAWHTASYLMGMNNDVTVISMITIPAFVLSFCNAYEVSKNTAGFLRKICERGAQDSTLAIRGEEQQRRLESQVRNKIVYGLKTSLNVLLLNIPNFCHKIFKNLKKGEILAIVPVILTGGATVAWVMLNSKYAPKGGEIRGQEALDRLVETNKTTVVYFNMFGINTPNQEEALLAVQDVVRVEQPDVLALQESVEVLRTMGGNLLSFFNRRFDLTVFGGGENFRVGDDISKMLVDEGYKILRCPNNVYNIVFGGGVIVAINGLNVYADLKDIKCNNLVGKWLPKAIQSVSLKTKKHGGKVQEFGVTNFHMLFGKGNEEGRNRMIDDTYALTKEVMELTKIKTAIWGGDANTRIGAFKRIEEFKPYTEHGFKEILVTRMGYKDLGPIVKALENGVITHLRFTTKGKDEILRGAREFTEDGAKDPKIDNVDVAGTIGPGIGMCNVRLYSPIVKKKQATLSGFIRDLICKYGNNMAPGTPAFEALKAEYKARDKFSLDHEALVFDLKLDGEKCEAKPVANDTCKGITKSSKPSGSRSGKPHKKGRRLQDKRKHKLFSKKSKLTRLNNNQNGGKKKYKKSGKWNHKKAKGKKGSKKGKNKKM